MIVQVDQSFCVFSLIKIKGYKERQNHKAKPTTNRYLIDTNGKNITGGGGTRRVSDLGRNHLEPKCARDAPPTLHPRCMFMS